MIQSLWLRPNSHLALTLALTATDYDRAKGATARNCVADYERRSSSLFPAHAYKGKLNVLESSRKITEHSLTR
jgi:hypothetical protein